MSHRIHSPQQADWQKVIRAQDDFSKQILQEEQDLQRQNKIRYRQELDKQLQIKNEILKFQHQNKTEELNFSLAQQHAMKDFDSKKKIQARNHQRTILNTNQSDQETRNRQYLHQTSQERKLEQDLNRKIQEDLEHQKKQDLLLKNKRIEEEREEIRRLNWEKIQKEKLSNIEKMQEKEMVLQQMSQMKKLESNHRDFYEKRMQDIDKRIKGFQPVLDLTNSRQELIRKRNDEWERTAKEKQALRQQFEEEARKKNTFDLKKTLDSQLDEKKKNKLLEVQTERYYQSQAKDKAAEELARFYNEKEKQIKGKEDLKKAYEDQLKEKDLITKKNLNMNVNEKKINSEVLSGIHNNKIVAFPGVPGAHESQIKKVFEKVYGSPEGKRIDQLYRVKSTGTPPPFLEQAYEQYTARKYYNFPDPYKHDPIANPIGAELPKVLSEERITRAPKSYSKLALAGGNLFK